MKAYRTKDGRDLYALAPWEGSAFQALGLGLSLGELARPSWRALLAEHGRHRGRLRRPEGAPRLPLRVVHRRRDAQYTGSVGIPEITVSPRPRITDAASLYTLGAAYSVAPDQVERFLDSRWPAISSLFTDHGPWEGFNVARREPIRFQTTAHTLALILGLIGRGSENLGRYLDAKGLTSKLAEFFPVGPGADLLASSPAFAWTAKDATLVSGKEGLAFRVRGESLPLVGIAFVPELAEGVNLSGGELVVRYRSVGVLDPVTIELKPVRDPSKDDSGHIPRAITTRFEATGSAEQEIRIPLPATPGLAKVKEVVIYHEGKARGPVDLTVTRLSVAPIGPK